jgi:hypothetical protein
MKFKLDIDTRPEGLISLAVLIEDDVVWPHPEQGDGSSEFDPEDVSVHLSDCQ